MAYIRNIQRLPINIYDTRKSEKQALPSAAPHWVCVSDYFISYVILDVPYIPYRFHIYIYIWILLQRKPKGKP